MLVEQKVLDIPTNELKEHPLNKELYDDALRPEEQAGILASIRKHSVRQPLVVNSDRTVLSGHRRLRAARELGLTTLPCIIQDPEDEALAIVEFNRYRRKTVSELMREAERLLAIETELAKDRQRFGAKSGEAKGRTQEKVAQALGIGHDTQLSKLKKVWQAAKANPQIAAKLKEIDAGKASINSVFKAISPKAKEDLFGFDLQVYSIWSFAQADLTLGMAHPGRIPGQVVQNLVYYYTKPGDLVVDPFGGGGITVDVCKEMNRRCLVTDIAPVRKDILQWDISNGFPREAYGCNLIFLDPPYWNMLEAEYKALSQDTAAALSLEDFQDWLANCIGAAFDTLQSGGHLAIIMMPQMWKLPDGIPYIDWPFEARISMDGAGFVPVARIVERWPTSTWTAQQVVDAKESKRMLQVHGDIIVGVKP